MHDEEFEGGVLDALNCLNEINDRRRPNFLRVSKDLSLVF